VVVSKKATFSSGGRRNCAQLPNLLQNPIAFMVHCEPVLVIVIQITLLHPTENGTSILVDSGAKALIILEDFVTRYMKTIKVNTNTVTNS